MRLRLLPGSQAVAHQLAGTAGACRFVWNHILARKQQQYRAYQCWQDYKIGPEPAKPQLSFFSLGKEFTALRQDPACAWLQAYSFKSVRYVLKYLADAYQAFFQGQRGYPVFKRQHDHRDGFTLPERVQVRDHQLYMPRSGWLRAQGQQPVCGRAAGAGAHPPGRPPGRDPSGTSTSPNAVPAASVRPGRGSGGAGAGTAMWARSLTARAPGTPWTDLGRLESQLARKQRLAGPQAPGLGAGAAAGRAADEVAAPAENGSGPMTPITSAGPWRIRPIPWWRRNSTPRAWTKSAKGTPDSPGTHVQAKAGLNRSILASNWGQLAQRLAYKCGRFETVDPGYTSQTCHPCGHISAANRQSQAVFRCQRCGFLLNADHNAALKHSGAVHPLCGPRDRGNCTARGVSPGNLTDP